MINKDKKSKIPGDSGEIKLQRKAQALKIKQLRDYKSGYDIECFLTDLVKYFDGKVDFNLERIRQEMGKPEKLACLIAKAKEKNTHPVTEFVEELFKDLAA
jgi:hypothetical protein